jgi:mono/diheme cytochrome c family protein
MKKNFRNILQVILLLLVSSCTYDNMKKPGYEFMPDMYRSPSYETYSENPNFPDSMTARQPVAGTVARGDAIYTDYDRLSYPFANTPEGYEEAGLKLINPLAKTPENMAEGKRLYENYCTHCHGATGQGDGLVVQRNGPKPPAYNSDQLKNLPAGKMFHSIHYGKNMMGSHASQLTPTQRWMIIHYIQTLQNSGVQTASGAQSDSAAAGVKKM